MAKLQGSKRGFMAKTPLWQRAAGKSKTGGLTKAGVASYRKENPGSKLSLAVTEKAPTGKRAKRKKAFCSRMQGLKDKLTSSKTAKDPKSRVNLALKKWRCQ